MKNIKDIVLFTLIGISLCLNLFTLHTFNNTSKVLTPSFVTFPSTPEVKPEPLPIINEIHVNYKIPKPIVEDIVQIVYTFTDNNTFPSPEIVFAVIANESSFNPNAVSSAGAFGLMQIMEKYHGSTPTIEDNIRTGIKVLKDYRKRTQTDLEALEAYNVGITGFLKGTKRNPKFVRDVLKYKNQFEI